MTDPDEYQGTGAEIGRVGLGPIGTLVIEDDGDPDPCIALTVEMDSYSESSFLSAVYRYRHENGDDGLEAALKALDAQAGDVKPPAYTPGGGVGFLCDECGRQWATVHNETPAGDDDVCPECIEDYEDGDSA